MNATYDEITTIDVVFIILFVIIFIGFLNKDEDIQFHAKNKHLDPMYKNFENSLKTVYEYSDIYVKAKPKIQWYVHCICPETRSKKDLKWFLEFAEKVIQDYPKTYLFKSTDDGLHKLSIDGKNLHYPLSLFIWRDDVARINDRAKNKTNESSYNKCANYN